MSFSQTIVSLPMHVKCRRSTFSRNWNLTSNWNETSLDFSAVAYFFIKASIIMLCSGYTAWRLQVNVVGVLFHAAICSTNPWSNICSASFEIHITLAVTRCNHWPINKPIQHYVKTLLLFHGKKNKSPRAQRRSPGYKVQISNKIFKALSLTVAE